MVINVVSVSGEHFYQESGAVVVVASGTGVTVQSGVFFASGVGVVVQSGLGVEISGQHVYVESGVFLASGAYVVADIAESGMGVQVQSGLNVIISGQPVTISGDHVFVESGVYIASGLYVVADIAESGMGVQVQSGVGVIIQSGLYLASGTILTADWMTEDKLLLYQIANPPNLDKIVNAIRTQQVSGLVTVTGGSITATVAGTNVNVSGFVDIQGRMLPINVNNLAWAQVVRTRIT